MTAATLLAGVCFLILVCATYSLGRRYGPRVGIASALLAACSPILLLQPSDDPRAMCASAAWIASLAALTGTGRRHAGVAGGAAAAAILVQPWLASLAVPSALFLLFRPERTWAQRVRAAVTFLAAAVAAVAIALATSSTVGAGSAGAFSLGVSLSSLSLLPVVIALAAPFLLPGALSNLLIACVVVDVTTLIWQLEHSTDVHLPIAAIVLTIVLAMAGVDAIWRRLGLRGATPAVLTTALAFAVLEYVG